MRSCPPDPRPAEPAGEVTALLRQVLFRLDELQAAVAGARKDFLTVDEVARQIGRSPYTVRRYITEGKLHATRVEGTGPRGRLLIPSGQLAGLVRLGLGDAIPAVAVPQASPAPEGAR